MKNEYKNERNKKAKETSYSLIHPIVTSWKQTLVILFLHLINKHFPPEQLKTTCDKENHTKLCKGTCETTFEKCDTNHKNSCNVPTHKNDSKLSNEYWTFKTKQLNPTVSWQIKRRYNSNNLISTTRTLCLNGKLEILYKQYKNLLNKRSRSEIISHYSDQNKFKLKTLASNTGIMDTSW